MAGHREDLIKNSITDNFCSEALVDIVMRLPVKSIGRFRCVCKSWNRSFTNPDFIKRHEHVHRSTFKTGDFVLLERDDREQRGTYCMWDSDSLEVIERLKLPIKIWPRNCEIEVVDCCDGLICLAESRYAGQRLASNTYFWNPAIKEYMVVPACCAHTYYSGYDLVAWGFAYEASTDDYKFVRVLQSHEKKPCEAEVYSLNRKSWTRFGVDIIIGCNQADLTPAFTNGTLHWMAMEESGENFILTYDVMKDTMGKVILSAIHEWETEANKKSVSLCGGQLCVIVQRLPTTMDHCDLWVMKKYGDPTSWSRLYTISPQYIMVTLGVLDRGELVGKVYDHEERILLCNFVTKEIRTLRVSGRATCVIKYRESLVSLKEQRRYYEPVPAMTGVEA